MLSPHDQATRGLTKPYLTYNEFSAKLLSNPAYYTDVCAVATLTDNYYHKKFNQNLVQTEEEKSTSSVSVAENMCRNNIQQSEYEQVSSKQPPDKNAERRESLSNGGMQSDAKDNLSTSVMPSLSTKTGTDGKCAKDNWNAFLSAESNFRKYQFQQKSPNGTNSDSNCVKDQPIESPSNKQPSGISDSEERLQRRTLNPMVIDLISDDEGSCEIPNCNLPDLDHNSSHSSLLDIKIIDLDPDPGASERLMPQLSPLDSDASVAESTKDAPPVIEIINLPSSPEMPTLIPFTTETEEPFKESSSCVSDNESNSSNRKDNHSIILDNDQLQPKVVLERISLENCFSAQKELKLLAVQSSTQSQKNKKIKTEHIVPEIDVIDGLNFLSFSSRVEMEKHCDVNRYKLLYNDKQIPDEVNADVKESVLIDKVCNDQDENKFNVVKENMENKFAIIENTNKDKLSSNQSSIIIPRTPDTAEVKDLKNKYLNSESEFTSVFEDSSQQKSGCGENKPTFPLLEEGSSHISINILHIKSDEKPSVISTPFNSVCNEMLKKVPEDSRGVFFSDDLESFLKNDAELHVELLQKVNPNIIPIASDNPILSLGKLKKSDDFKIHVPRRSFMRQRSSLNSVSIPKQENKPFHSLMKDKTSGQSSNSSTPSPIFHNIKNPPNYSVANVKRKFDGMHKSLKKAKLCQSRTGIGRLVLRLKKKYSGLSDEYKVANIANTCPKTKSNLNIFKRENTCTDRNSLMVIKETAFSTQEKEKEKAILDVFLRNFNSFGTTKGLVNMLFTSTGSIFLNNEVLEPDLCAAFTSVKSLLNSKCINTKIRCKRSIFSPTMLLTKRSNLLESSAFNIEAESSSNDEVEEESGSEEDEVSTSEADVEQESVSEDDVKEESSDFEEKLKFERVNCAVRGKNNKSSPNNISPNTLRQMKRPEALSRNKRNTRMPQRLLDSAILAPGSEWVSPMLIEENQNGLRKNKKSTILSKQIVEQEPIAHVSRVTPINSYMLSIGKGNAFGVDGKSVACNASTLATMLTEPKIFPQQSSFPKGKRITKNSFCVCQNVARAMAFDCTLERLTCRCMSAALANFDSSVVDVTAITMQKSKSEVEYIENTTTVHASSSDISTVPNSPVRTKKDSGKTAIKMPGNHKELGLHNYAANPNLEGVFWKGKKTPSNLNTSIVKDLENIQGELLDVEVNEVRDTRAASSNVTENEKSKRENCHLRGHIDHSMEILDFSIQTNRSHATSSTNPSQFLPLKSTYNEEVANTGKSTSSDILNALPIDHQINSLQAYKDKIPSDGISLEELSILASGKRLNNTNCPVLPKGLTDAIKQNSHASFNSSHPKDLYDAKEASEVSISAPHKKTPVYTTVNCPVSTKGGLEKPMTAAASTSAFCRKTSTPVPIKPKPSPLLQSPMNAAMVEQVKKQFMKIGFVFRTPPKTQQQLASQINAAIARSETCDFSPSPIASLTQRLESMRASNTRLAQRRKEKVQSLDNADELVIDLSDTESVQSFVDIEAVDQDLNIEQSKEQKGGLEISDLSLFSSSDEEQEDLDNLRSSLHPGNTASKSVKERMRRRHIQNAAENLRTTLGMDEAHSKMHLKELLDSATKHISTLRPLNISLNRQVHQLLRKREALKERYRELALELPPDQRKKHALTTMSILRTAVPNHGSRVMDTSPVSSKTETVSEKETICIDLVDSEDEAAATNDTAKKDVPLTNHDSHNDSNSQLASGVPLSRGARPAEIESKLSQYNIQFKTFPPTSSVLQDSSLLVSGVRNLNESVNLYQPTSTSAVVIQAPPSIALPGVIRPTVIKEVPLLPLSYQPFANCQNTLGRTTPKTTQEIINENFKRKTSLNNGKMVHIAQPERLVVTPVRAPSVSPITSSGHQRIQSVFSALQQISRPVSMPKQTTHNSVNFDSPPSTYCNMAFSSLPDTMPLQKNEDIMNLRKIMDVTEDTKSVASSSGGDEVKGVLKSSETDFILPDDFVTTTDIEEALIGVAQELTVSQVEDSTVDRVEELIENQVKDLSVDRVEELMVSEIEDLSVDRVEGLVGCQVVENLSAGELPMEAVKELPVGEVKDIATQNCSNGTEPGS